MESGAIAISENRFLLYALFMGIAMTFAYDIFRILRRVWPHNRLMISLEDALFWLVTAIAVFCLMHTQSNGKLRWFAVCGALFGMIVYKKTLSRSFVKYLSLLLTKVSQAVGKLLAFIGKPFGFCAKKGKKAGEIALCGARRTKGALKKRLTAFVKMLKMMLCKQ